jgi:hypothetical protein
MMLCGCSKIIVKPGVKVITIEPSADALSVEEVVKLFCTVFKQFCALKVVDKLAVDRLTHGLTTAEVTAVFRGQGLGRAARSEPQPGVYL